ncbi:MAG: ABC transporter substrate-binding protein [Candidatus Bathyarchaeota archaeon]|nr:ABC transporter substrate-binding protein [Candidatus Bathyarchaeota archaeon]
MRRNVVLAVVLVSLIASVSVYGTYNLLFSSSVLPSPSPSPTPVSQPTPTTSLYPSVTASHSPSPTQTAPPSSTPTSTSTPQNNTVVIIDEFDRNVTVALPVNRIVCLNGGSAEIICALGGEDKIVGMGGDANWPQSVNSKTSVGTGSTSVNLELILEMEPDLVVADSSIFYDNATLDTLESVDIPLYIEDPALPDRVDAIVSNFGLILDNEEKAVQINNNTQFYMNLIQQRIQNATPTTFLAPMSYGWYFYGSNSKIVKLMELCGGTNLFANSSGAITPEFAAEANPDVLICQTPAITSNVTVFQETIADFSSRDAFLESTAVKEGRVYAYTYWVGTGIEYPAGALFFAKWLHPDLFADIDPAVVYRQLIQEYFGITPEGVYGYPDIVTITDATGAQATVNLPVRRIVSLTSGFTEIVCALGGENLIVGRGQYSTFPPSVVDMPVAGSSSYSPNVEVILDMAPDVVLTDNMLIGRQQLTQLQDAGIPVIIESPADLSRIATMIHTVGLLVNNETGETELLDWMNYYLDLVSERTANLTASEKPSVYNEYNVDWSAFGPRHSVGQLMSTAGGLNILTNSSTSLITVSAEYVLEHDPDAIFKYAASLGPANVTFYQDKMNALVGRTGFSELSAVKEGHVYLYDYSLIQGLRYPVGLVYFAKCLHPDLFTDVNPTAMLEELNQKFFGVELEGVYVYP